MEEFSCGLTLQCLQSPGCPVCGVLVHLSDFTLFDLTLRKDTSQFKEDVKLSLYPGDQIFFKIKFWLILQTYFTFPQEMIRSRRCIAGNTALSWRSCNATTMHPRRLDTEQCGVCFWCHLLFSHYIVVWSVMSLSHILAKREKPH